MALVKIGRKRIQKGRTAPAIFYRLAGKKKGLLWGV